MCHFSVQQRHPLSLLTTSIFIAEKVIAQRHGLNLALVIRFNAAPYKGTENGKFRYRVGLQS
ncbi:hypothetical protein DFS28_11030 [Pseudomonas sp. 478]|nr:hypothetical protein DFS28_11030 [Pseudomonas sp. 478]TCV50395.1 hypothetical protein EDB99_10930 [Pseudomonas sp. 460]